MMNTRTFIRFLPLILLGLTGCSAADMQQASIALNQFAAAASPHPTYTPPSYNNYNTGYNPGYGSSGAVYVPTTVPSYTPLGSGSSGCTGPVHVSEKGTKSCTMGTTD